MRTDMIEAVGIDEGGSLWVKPAAATFPYVYREARDVHWDAEQLRLYSPAPRAWPYAAWFSQIREAARSQGVELKLGDTTCWSGIDTDLQQALVGIGGGFSSGDKS